MEKDHFFAEWVEYRDEEEKKEANQYLILWKKFFMRKVSYLELINEQFIDKPKPTEVDEFIIINSTLGIKLHMMEKKPKNNLV